MRILYVCTHNRCRSILCEALTNALSGGRISASSAGSEPAGKVHPQTLKHLAARGIDTSSLHSQSWDVFAGEAFDAVITVCDSAAQEDCPLWGGTAIRVHWGLLDPSRLADTPDAMDAAFNAVIAQIETRVRRMLALEVETLRGETLRDALLSSSHKET